MLDDPARSTRDGRTLRRTILERLRQEIAAGIPPVGQSLPGEHELCNRFGVSRHTVREALRDLAGLGLVSRRQGSGTRVINARPETRYVHSMRSLEELQQYATHTRLVLQAIEPSVALRGEQAEAVGASPRERWVRITGVRLDGDEPICATVALVRRKFAPLLHDVERHVQSGTIYDLVEQRSGEPIAAAEQEIAARVMPAAASRALGVGLDTPALLFTRRYLDAAGKAMVCSLNWHRADRFTYRMRLRRDG